MAERLGRYVLERKIAAGGMAEVFLAKQSGPEGFEKLCVVKRMLPSLAADPNFVRMFLDEARLAAQLNHPNIAQIFDFGESKGTYFLAMEHVPGSNLRAIVKDHARRGVYVPVGVAARIISQAALALDYAHNASSVDGKPLGFIHRDVSPQNILLGTAGTVKLIDFGVAKATIATHHTQTGLIKGKFAYMSPEQIRALPLDRRSDLYSLGLVLYELLASTRAIQGPNDVAIMENAMRMAFDPIERKRPDLPEAMRQIVLRALAKDREARYQTALEMSEDLERFLTSQGLVVTGADLIRLVGDMPSQAPLARSEEPASGSSSSAKQPAVAIQPAFWEEDPHTVPTEVGSRLALEATLLRDREAELAAAPTPALGSAPAEPSDPGGWRAIAGSDVALIGGAPTSPGRVRPELPEAPVLPSEVKSIGSATSYQHLLQRQRRRTAAVAILVVGGGIAAAFWIAGRGRQEEVPAAPVAVPVAAAEPVAPPEPVAPAPAPPAPPPAPTARPKVQLTRAPATAGASAGASKATLAISSTPPMEIWVDGVTHGRSPVTVQVSPGIHLITFRDESLGLRRTSKVEVGRGESRSETWSPSKGKVSVRAVPYAEVFLGERSLGLTPLAPLELWEGTHRFRFVNKDTGRTETREVEVEPGKDTLVKVDLRAP